MENTELILKKSSEFKPADGPIVTIVLDGVGLSDNPAGNAVKSAQMPHFSEYYNKYQWMKLKAHGKAVGLPSDDDMGNSEVGHNAMGAGRIFSQGAKLVNEDIATGKIWESNSWKQIVQKGLNGGTVHFIGLFSDGNVHSHLDHLKKLLERCKADKVNRVRIHILLDGRDVAPTSALKYVEDFEQFLNSLRDGDFDVAIASGGGRMVITMDRYEADWAMVEKGWEIQVHGKGRQFASAKEAIETLRNENPGITDQNLPGFVIAKDGLPLGTINDGDAAVFFNFRGDRAIEVSRAFTEENFSIFDRGRVPQIFFAGMLQYDGDLKIPKNFLVQPPAIDRTMGEYLAKTGIYQYAISETQKFGHVTYFWNGNRSGKFDNEKETYQEIASDRIPFEEQPAMKAKDITDALIDAIKSGKYSYLRVNYANGDMVGHTGNFEASVKAMESLDQEINRLVDEVLATHGIAMITADHGNVEEKYQLDKNGEPLKDSSGNFMSKTSHTLNPVPFILIGENLKVKLKKDLPNAGLANIAATVFNLLGYEAPKDYNESLIENI